MTRAPYVRYKSSRIDWLGDIPSHWEVKRLDFLASVKGRLGWKALTADEYLPQGFIFLSTPNIKGERDIDFENVNYISSHRYYESPEIMLRGGDVLLAKDGSTLGITNVVRHLPNPATVNSSIAVVRPKPELDSIFLFRWLTGSYLQAVIASMKDGQGVPHLFQADIRKFVVLLPSRPEQRAIAGFLDRETARLDTLVAKKWELIEKLKEKRIALISRTVTKGLPAEAAAKAGLKPHAKFKLSGIEWLGNIPEHWKVKAIKWESPVKRGASPRPIDDEKYFDDDGEYAWVRISDVTSAGDYLDKTEQRTSVLGSSLSVKLDRGALFLSIAGSVGKPCITNIKCCIHDGFVYFPTWRGSARFLFYIFASGEPYKGLGKLGTQLNLNTDTVGSIRIGVPPMIEQRAIAEYLDGETAKIDKMMEKVEAAIEKLQEYRTALITAAVMGKIDVRKESHG